MWQNMHRDVGRGEHAWWIDARGQPFNPPRYQTLTPYIPRFFSPHEIQTCAKNHYGPKKKGPPSLLYLARRKVQEMTNFSKKIRLELGILAMGYRRDFRWLSRGVAYADEKERQRAADAAAAADGEDGERQERQLTAEYAKKWKKDWDKFDSLYFPDPIKQIDGILKASEEKDFPPVYHFDKLPLFYALYDMQIQNLAIFRLQAGDFSPSAEYMVNLQERNKRGHRCWAGRVSIVVSLQPCRREEKVGKRKKRRTAEAFFRLGIRSPFVLSWDQLKAIIIFAWERTEAGRGAHKAVSKTGFYYGLQRTFLLSTLDLAWGKKERFFTRRARSFTSPLPHARGLADLFLRKDYPGREALLRFRDCAIALYRMTQDPDNSVTTEQLPFGSSKEIRDFRLSMNRAYVVFHEPLRDFLLVRPREKKPLPPLPPPAAAAEDGSQETAREKEELLPEVFPVQI